MARPSFYTKMKILTLENYEAEFLQYCKKFYANDDRNREWFNPKLHGVYPTDIKSIYYGLS